MRRRHPERGLLAPAEFLPHVERTPLIRALTLHVVAEALAETRRWPQEWGDDRRRRQRPLPLDRRREP